MRMDGASLLRSSSNVHLIMVTAHARYPKLQESLDNALVLRSALDQVPKAHNSLAVLPLDVQERCFEPRVVAVDVREQGCPARAKFRVCQ